MNQAVDCDLFLVTPVLFISKKTSKIDRNLNKNLLKFVRTIFNQAVDCGLFLYANEFCLVYQRKDIEK